MKNRLKQLICETLQVDGCIAHCNHPYCCVVDSIADHLICNGVVVPPIRVGQTIYRIIDGNSILPDIYDWEVVEMRIFEDEVLWVDDSDNPIFIEDINKTVYLTREDAQMALNKKYNKNNTE